MTEEQKTARDAAWLKACHTYGFKDTVPVLHQAFFNDAWNAAIAHAEAERAEQLNALREIHKISSAGCPVGEDSEETFEGISAICAEVLR